MRICLLVVCSLLMAACSSPDVQSPAELNAIYEQVLQDTAARAVAFEAGSEEESAVIDRLQNYFANMTPESVANSTADVYAQDALLYDNVVALQGQEAVKDYFTNAAADVSELRVGFIQVAQADSDYYIRWKMTIVSDKIAAGEPLVSYGVTQFRFDAAGRVLLHRDFWDASTGLYEYLPVAGNWLMRLRGMLGGHAES